MKQVIYAPWLVVIHPDYAHYDSDVGLVIGEGGSLSEVRYMSRPPIPRYHYSYETYITHIARTLSECKSLLSKHSLALSRTEPIGNSGRQGYAGELALLAASLHDVGKLSSSWQASLRQWQAYKDSSKLGPEPLAHTDYDPIIDSKDQVKYPHPPPHALEGAYAVVPHLTSHLPPELAGLIFSVIARHHSPDISTLDDFSLIEEAEKWVHLSTGKKVRLWDHPQPEVRVNIGRQLYSFTDRQNNKLWGLYVLLVRLARLADQGSLKSRDG